LLGLEERGPRLFLLVNGSRAGKEAKLRLLLRTTGRMGLEPSEGVPASSSSWSWKGVFEASSSASSTIGFSGDDFLGEEECMARTGDDIIG
jgi:hypothetical protein